MEILKRTIGGFPKINHTPIPGLSLSASGLLALADLSTIAQRTAITGGSSWLDSLVLAPGLHYQQAADELVQQQGGGFGRGSGGGGGGGPSAVETSPDGRVVTHAINNAATMHYISRVARAGEVVTVDVGTLPPRTSRRELRRKQRQSLGRHAEVWLEEESADFGWLSQLLYLASPVLTVCALVVMILIQDWWGLGLLSALMLSRILNIWVIKQRSKPATPPAKSPESKAKPKTKPKSGTKPKKVPKHEAARQRQSYVHQHNEDGDPEAGVVVGGGPSKPKHESTYSTAPLSSSYLSGSGPSYADHDASFSSDSDSDSSHHHHHHALPHLTSLLIDLPDGRNVCLRGMSDDLAAITASAWLRSKTAVEGYLEAAAKLLVYLVAALSGNQTQAGAIAASVLLLCSAGLLALSNAHARGLRMNGRVAAPYVPPASSGGKKKSGGAGEGGGEGEGTNSRGEKVPHGTPGDAPYPSGSERTESWPGSSGVLSGVEGLNDDWAEKGQVGVAVRERYPFDDGVDYT